MTQDYTPTCSKRFACYPFAHRQPNHAGHCRFIHGHNWDFHITFAATRLDACGFVIDFGGLGFIKDWLGEWFDHTVVLNADDPQGDALEQAAVDAVVRRVPDCSCEGLAVFVAEQVNAMVASETGGRVRVATVIVFEDEKNSATCDLSR